MPQLIDGEVHYPYDVDRVAQTLAGLQREELEALIYGGMQFTADIVGRAEELEGEPAAVLGASVYQFLEENGFVGGIY